MWISIEGNRASIVESVLQDLKNKSYNVSTLADEEFANGFPIEFWKSAFNKDKSRWAFALQMKILAFLVKAKESSKNTPVQFIEGSCLSIRHVYGQLYYNSGFLSSKEWDLLKNTCDFVKWTPDVLVYLHNSEDQEIEHKGDQERLEFLYHNMLKFYPGKVVYVDTTNLASGEVISTMMERMSEMGIEL